MDAAVPDLPPGQRVRVFVKPHPGRLGMVVVGEGDPPARCVWVDFGDGVALPVDRRMIAPVVRAYDDVIDPVEAGLAALRTWWPV
jgi:hypothetical protein